MGGECAHANQMVLWVTIRYLEVLKCGGLHLVITEVASVGGGVDKEKSSYVVQFLSGELRMIWS